MSKRPWVIYLVALWTLFASTLTVMPLARTLFPHDGPPGETSLPFQLTRVLSTAFIAYVVVGLIQLRATQRWIATVLVGLFANLILIRSYFLVTSSGNPLRAAFFVAVVVIASTASIWYLVRPSFRTFAAQYRAERTAEAMQKHVSKRVRNWHSQ